jgi:hypothetical protein
MREESLVANRELMALFFSLDRLLINSFGTDDVPAASPSAAPEPASPGWPALFVDVDDPFRLAISFEVNSDEGASIFWIKPQKSQTDTNPMI